MYLRVIGTIILIIIISLLDVSFMSHLPFGLFRLHLLVIGIIFAFLLGNLRLAVWWALGGGLILELFSFGNFGWYILAGCLSAITVWFLFERVMTNRSLYSVSAVAAAATLVYDLVMLLGTLMEGRPTPSLGLFLNGEFLGMVYSVIVALAVFYVSNAVSRRLHPAFLSYRSHRV